MTCENVTIKFDHFEGEIGQGGIHSIYALNVEGLLTVQELRAIAKIVKREVDVNELIKDTDTD